MNQENPVVPSNFRGLRILVVDNDTSSLLAIASQLENFSYIVTTTELPAVALSLLQEGADSFDLIMADINMPDFDCFEFMKSVQLIKDLPIILISAGTKRSVVEEAIMKGACFFLRKPISSKNLINVWQHFYRETRGKNGRKSGGDEEARVEEQEKVIEVIGNEQAGDGDQARTDQGGPVDGTELTESKQAGKKRAMSPPENDAPGEIKRMRTENEGGMTSQNLGQSPFFTTNVGTENLDLAMEFASSYATNQEQARFDADIDFDFDEFDFQFD